MISDRKCKGMLFVDYGLTLLFGVLGLLILSWLFRFSWGYIVYSILFSLVFFGLVYSRLWNKAKSDLKYQKEKIGLWNPLRYAAPLVIVLFVIALLFALIQSNIIPIGNLVTDVRYVLEENKPRQMVEVHLIDSIVPVVRVLFSFLIGFMPLDKTPLPVLLIAPLLALIAAFLGYRAGLKKFYLSELILKTKEKAKDKFNE